MKKLLLALSLFVTPAYADYTIYTSGGAGGATGQWNIAVAGALSMFTNKPVKVEHIKGSGGRKVFDEYWKNFDKGVVLSFNSDYATNYMVNPKWKKIDFAQYCPVLLMNHSSVVYTHNDIDPMTFTTGSVAIHGKSIPDMMGLVMLAVGPATTSEYLAHFGPDGINPITGLKGPDRRMGILNGELDFSRAPGSRVLKEDTLMNKVEGPRGGYKPLFSWGIQTLEGIRPDPNETQRGPLFETLFAKRWGEMPQGEFYSAMRTAANASHLLDGLFEECPDEDFATTASLDAENAFTNPEILNVFNKEMGKYDWYTGVHASMIWSGVITALQEPATLDMITKVYKTIGLEAKPRIQ